MMMNCQLVKTLRKTMCGGSILVFFFCYPVAFDAFGMLFAHCFADHPPDMHVHIMIEMM